MFIVVEYFTLVYVSCYVNIECSTLMYIWYV